MGWKIVKGAGYVWLTLAVAVILIGYASVAYFHGFGALQEMLSPHNVTNFLAVGITLAPGLLLVHFGEKWRKRATPPNTLPQ